MEYVLTIVIAFAGQACAAARAGEFSASEIGLFVEDFERRATVHAYDHLELGRLWYRWEAFRNEVLPHLHRSNAWLGHLRDRERSSPTASAIDVNDVPNRTSHVPNNSGGTSEAVASTNATVGLLRTAQERRAAVEAYIQEVWTKKERRITRKDIWKAARYGTRTEFERWQRCDRRTTKSAHQRFVRVLTEKPHLK